MLTLDEFLATGRRITDEDEGIAATSIPLSDHADAVALWVYDRGCWLVEYPNGVYWSLVERDEMEGRDRDAVAAWVWREHYLSLE